jgi:hypothetical protein
LFVSGRKKNPATAVIVAMAIGRHGPSVNVAGRSEGDRNRRQQTAEPAVADVIGQRTPE